MSAASGGTFIPPNPSPGASSELTVLGSVLADNKVLDTMTITGEDFDNPLYADTFDAMLALYAEGKPIDAGTLGYQRPTHTTFYWELTEWGQPYAADFHAEQVRANAVRRHLAAAGEAVSIMAQDTSIEVDDLTERSRMLVDDAIGIRQALPATSETLVPRVIESIGRATPGLPTPWRGLTRIIRGFRPGSVYVIAARPGVGKSALALQIASELERHGSVAYFTLEMGADEVTQRLIAQQAWVPLSQVDGSETLTPEHKARIDEWAERYSGKILFDDRGSITIREIRAQVRTWARTENLAAVVIDYTQLIDGPSGWTKQQVVAEITRAQKMLAKDFNIPVIALSQLNRNPEGRVDKRPAMADLRESGTIEQDADVVMLLYNATESMGEPSMTGDDDLEVIVAKSRQGPTQTVHLRWQGRYVSALDLN